MNEIKKFNFAIVFLFISCFSEATPVQRIVYLINQAVMNGRTYNKLTLSFIAYLNFVDESGLNGSIAIVNYIVPLVYRIEVVKSCKRECLGCMSDYFSVLKRENGVLRICVENLRGIHAVADYILDTIMCGFGLVSRKIGLSGNNWSLKFTVTENVVPGGINEIKVYDPNGKIICTIGQCGFFICCVVGEYELSVLELRNHYNWNRHPWNGIYLLKPELLTKTEFTLEEAREVAYHDYLCCVGYDSQSLERLIYCSDFGRGLVIEILENMKPGLLSDKVKSEILIWRRPLDEIFNWLGLSYEEGKLCKERCLNKVISDLIEALCKNF